MPLMSGRRIAPKPHVAIAILDLLVIGASPCLCLSLQTPSHLFRPSGSSDTAMRRNAACRDAGWTTGRGHLATRLEDAVRTISCSCQVAPPVTSVVYVLSHCTVYKDLWKRGPLRRRGCSPKRVKVTSRNG